MSDKVLKNFFPPDLLNGNGDWRLHLPEFAFTPDHWNHAFIRGLFKLPLDFRRVLEVGCGSGVNLLLLQHQFPNATFFASDYSAPCADLTLDNLRENGCAGRATVLPGSWDLLTPPVDSTQPTPLVEYVIACIPQVPSPDADFLVNDTLAHYYHPQDYPAVEKSWHDFGLGLICALLRQVKERQPSNCAVVCNLGGRPGIGRLERLYRNTGFTPEVVHQEIIPQHPETCLQSLVDQEQKLLSASQPPFEFFADSEGRLQIGAAEAEKLRVSHQPVFHKIYVMIGR